MDQVDRTPRGLDRSFHPRGIAARRGGADEEPTVRFRERLETVTEAATPGAFAELNVWPPHCIRALELGSHLRVDLARVGKHVLHALSDRNLAERAAARSH